MNIIRSLRWRATLRRRLLITITGIHLILMILFVSDLTERQQQFIVERGRERAAYEADFLAASATQQLATRDYAGLQDLVLSAAADQSVRFVSVTDEGGKVLAHSDAKRVGLYHNDERARKVFSGPRQPSIVYENERYIHAVSPIRMEGELLGWTWVAKDLSSDIAAIHDVRIRGFQYLLIAVAAGAISAWLIAQGITRQLRALTAGAQRLVANKLDTPVPRLSHDEVGDLADAFNRAMRELSKYQNALSAEVAERTRVQAEVQRANEALVKANDSLGQFAYAASHDLQEPLRAVAMYSDLLDRRYKGKLDAQADQFIGYIHAGAVRMQKLVLALLEYSRAGGRSDAPTETVDCRKALDTALGNLKVALDSVGAHVEIGELAPVLAHEVAVVQIFQNLIGNAVKYAGETRPAIRVWSELRPADDCVCVSVQDNGIGISPEHHERIFIVFKRVHGDKYPGSGLGLAICRKIVERYGGRIWVESQPGQGATFRFTLPMARATSASDSGGVSGQIESTGRS